MESVTDFLLSNSLEFSGDATLCPITEGEENSDDDDGNDDDDDDDEKASVVSDEETRKRKLVAASGDDQACESIDESDVQEKEMMFLNMYKTAVNMAAAASTSSDANATNTRGVASKLSLHLNSLPMFDSSS